MRVLGVVLVLSVLSACASGPADPSLDAEAKLFRASADKACMYIAPSNSPTAVNIAMDGRRVATLDAQNFLRLDVAPGRHVLTVAPAGLAPIVFREKGNDVPVDAEAGRCLFFRAAWTEDGGGVRPFRVHLERVTEGEGQRAVNVRTLTLPAN